MNNFVPREKESRAVRVNLSRAPKWRTDRAKPQQDVPQLYRIASSAQSQSSGGSNRKQNLRDYCDVAGK
jgi:hypothetical protein